nr:zinc finger BED domain-containing protein RICESLEEPER 2-like [Tanacetum cinerariifolium]
MAAHFLVIPITTVASEATFSVGGRVIDTYRASLDPEAVQALICGGDWIRKVHGVKKKNKVSTNLFRPQLDGMPTHKRKFSAPTHTKNIFGNTRRIGKGFSGKVTPLFQTMVIQNQSELGEGFLIWRRQKTTQRNEIDSLKRRVKKLEKRNRSRTHKLKRLYKVGLSTRIESSGDEESLGKDASKQGKRIDANDADEDITLVNDANKEMFDVDDLGGEEIFVAWQNDNVVDEVVNAAQVSTAATTVTITTKEITFAQALEALKTLKPKVKGMVFQEPDKSTTTTTIISSQHSQDKGKGIMIEEPMKSKKKDQIRLDEEASLKLQAKFNEEERLARDRAKKEQEANIALIET